MRSLHIAVLLAALGRQLPRIRRFSFGAVPDYGRPGPEAKPNVAESNGS